MGPISLTTTIDAPRERVFDEISDLSRRPAWTDHFVSDLHLQRIDPSGRGAAARFRVGAPGGLKFMETVIDEAERPHTIREHGRGGRWDRIPIRTSWELSGGEGALTDAHPHFLDRAVPSARQGAAAACRRLVEAPLAQGAAATCRADSSPRLPRPSAWASRAATVARRASLEHRRAGPADRLSPLMNPGRGRNRAFLALLATVALSVGVAACGAEEETELVDGEEIHAVVEGEPLELGDLRFNVTLTRFLNPEDTEDAQYLRGLPVDTPNQDYLAVFMAVENEGDEDLRLPGSSEIRVEDTTGAEYRPLEVDPLFGFELNGLIPAGGEVPTPDSAAASGPTQGAVILFLVDQDVSANRPLELILLAEGEEGLIELDI